jgi:hypothetical protein
MWSSVNKILHLPQLIPSKPSPAPLATDEALDRGSDRMEKILKALAKATSAMGVLLDLDSKRYHELSRMGHYLKQVGGRFFIIQ